MAMNGRRMGRLRVTLLLCMAAPLQAQAPYVPDVTEAREKEWRKLAATSQAAYLAGQKADGIETARKALGLADELFGADDPRALISANDLALQLESAGHFREAEGLFRRVFDSYLRTRGDDDPNTQLALENLIDFYMARKRYDVAEPLADYALASFRRTTGAASARSQRMAQIIAAKPEAGNLAEKAQARSAGGVSADISSAGPDAAFTDRASEPGPAAAAVVVESLSINPRSDPDEKQP